MKSFLSESGYIFDQQDAVWKRADYAGIAYSDGAEVEQRMLDAVRATNELGSVSPELALKITDWPTLYHFSSRRANLLRPFEHLFRAGRHVLEVGSGCGAITRFLGECGGDIIALEGSLIRAATTAARCRDLANVAVIADAFDKVAPRPQFDVVTLIGVLEYARKYFPAQGGDPVDALLRHAQSFLKPGGVLIVAIENQLGIKYFAGAAEDHLGVSMYGIEDRYNDASPVTFGKQELRSRLERAGLSAQDWWFPFPDYKLPTSVVSEEGLKGTIGQQLDALLGRTFEADVQLPRHPVFLLDRAWKPVVRNGMGADLANSFLVFAGRGAQVLPKNKRKEVACHFSVDRKPEFAKSTVFSVNAGERITTCQIPIFPKFNGDNAAPIQIHRDTKQPFIEGKLWSQELKEILTHDGWTQSEFNAWAKRWFSALLEQANLQGQEAQLTNNHLLPGSLIDAVPRNLIVTPDGKSVFFDQEYSVQLPLELGFMLFRGIYLLSLLDVGKVASPSVGTSVHGVALFKAVAQSLGLWITEADLSRYIAFENDFQTWVTGRPCYKLEDALAFSLDIRLPLDRRKSREEQLADAVRENAELRSQIDTVNQAMTERDDQIAGLNQAVSERDGQIAGLNQAVSERDGQIAGLNQAVSERDGQIAGLSQAVSERDGQIAGLSQAVSERDDQLVTLNQAVTERDARISGMLQSRSWRLTGPLRGIGSGIRALRRAFKRLFGKMPLIRQARIRRIRTSPLFDADFYAERSPDVVAAGVDLAKHYTLSGWKEYRNPSVEFSTRRYLEANPDVAAADINPLLHYIDRGQAEGRPIHYVEEEAQIEAIRDSGLFDADYYLATYTDIQPPPQDPIRHYCEFGWREGRNPSAEFDTQGYLAAYADIKGAGTNPFWHYVVAGRAELRHANPERGKRIEAEVEAIRASGLFDADYYLATYPDIPPTMDPIRHYCIHGWHEGRCPSAEFDTQGYLEVYSDVKDAEMNPLWHYVVFGQYESRHANPRRIEAEIEAIRTSDLFDADYYLATYPDIQPPMDPIRHYCECGWHEGRNPSKEFNTQGYLAAYNDVKDAAINPLWHYVLFGQYESRCADPERGKRIEVEEEAIPAAADIAIATSDNPLVSFIIPIYGKVDYTLRCLASIAKHLPEAAIEVIIVDDCSPDDSLNVLSEVKGIRLLRNKQNQGFIRSCNMGAKAAKGQYLYFLNNDTKVTEGWLDALLRTFSDFPGTGLAGSKLVYPDGRLQEAGGIIWQDGSAWNFGRFQNPHLPVYNYAREVDYCSGASIMVPKSLFEELGGFDEHYSPAYCEDSDLALKIRDKGYRVIYQPLSTVIHYEGITSGTDITQGTKAYQVVNSKKQFARWQQRLSTHQAPGRDVDNAKDRKSTRRVLFLDHCTPTPNQDSGSIDAYNQMLLMREMGFQVTFIPEDNFLYMPGYTSDLQCKGIETLYAPYVMSVEQHVKEHGDRYDLVFISRPGAFNRNIDLIRKYCRKAKVLFHTVDLHFLRMGREADLLKSNELNRTAAEMKKRELAYIAAADVSTVVSVEELAVVQRHLPDAKVKLLPFSRVIRGTKSSFSERANISFVGGYQHPPNVDAVQYFVKDVMPLLRKQLPGVRFYAVGSKVPAEIQALASEDVIITGFVEDLDSLLDKMRVSVAPLRYGAGIKGKIGTAMAVGLPVVATSLATEGMSLTDGENILVADGAEALAETLARIYQDESLWNRISKNGLSFAENAWGSESAWEILAAILADIGIQVKRRAYPLSLYSPSR